MKNNRNLLVVLQIFLGLGLAGYAHLGSYTRMIADDFCSGYHANRLGLLRSVWYWYISWSGRYSAFVADWLVLKFTLGPHALHYIVPVMIILWLIFLTFIIHAYLENQVSNAILHSILLSTGFLFTLFLLSPNVPQSLFWWNGARAYSLPLMLLTGCAFLFRAARHFPKVRPNLGYGLSFALLFLIGGMGETYAIGQAGFLSFLIFLNIAKWRKERRTDLYTLMAGLAGTIVSLVVIIMAPGNAIRQSLLPPSPDLGKLLSVSVQGYLLFIRDLLIDPKKVTGLLGVILLCIWTGMQYRDDNSSNTRLIIINALGGIALSFLCFPPGVYGYSEPPPSRTYIIPTFFLLLFTLYTGCLAGKRLTSLSGSLRNWGNLIMAVLFVLIGYSTITNSMELLEQRREYIEFANKWDEVDKLILNAKAGNQASVNIPAMNNWAHLEAPTDNPRNWVTYCYSKYYGIQVVGPPFDEIIKNYQQQGSE